MRFNGFVAMHLLKAGRMIRRVMWTKNCFVYMKTTEDGERIIAAHGTPTFVGDFDEFPNMLLEQMLEDGDQWECLDVFGD